MRFGRKQSEALLDPGKADLVAETADGVVELVIVAEAPCTGRVKAAAHHARTAAS